MPPHLNNDYPAYFIAAGLVFTPLTEPYLISEYGAEYESEAPVKQLDRLYHGFPSAPGEQVVLLSQVLADETTLGYEEVNNLQVWVCAAAAVRVVVCCGCAASALTAQKQNSKRGTKPTLKHR